MIFFAAAASKGRARRLFVVMALQRLIAEIDMPSFLFDRLSFLFDRKTPRRLAAGLVLAATFAAASLAGPAQAYSPIAAMWPFQEPPGPDATRTLAWTGGEHLGVALPANVRYVVGPRAGIVITGPRNWIEHILANGGDLRFDRSMWNVHGIHIVVTAPRLSDVSISGSGTLAMDRQTGDRLDAHVSGSGSLSTAGDFNSMRVGISGSGDIRASGSVQTLDARISGSGDADLGALATNDLKGHISGSGSLKSSPRRSADVGISGSGDVRLLTRPAQLIFHKSGSGRIVSPPVA